MPASVEVYKVVRNTFSGLLSTNSGCVATYVPRQTTYPPIDGSKLFAFATLEHAREWLAVQPDWLKRESEIWVGNAIGVTPMARAASMLRAGTLERWWHDPLYTIIPMATPQGTVGCAAITLRSCVLKGCNLDRCV